MINFSHARIRLSCLLFLTLTALHRAEGFTPLALHSEEAKIQLIELYTSEGCSSCPPAESWFSSLKQNPALWKRFVPVAFHVDYWNYLGWTDPYASADYSVRQRSYANALHTGSIYTPEFFLNGKEWKPDIFEIPTSVQTTGSLNATLSDSGKVELLFKPLNRHITSYVIEVALLECDLSNSVTRGENAGRILHHDFVAYALLKSKLTPDGERGYKAAITLPSHHSMPSTAIAIWVREEQSLIPIQALGGWLK